MEPKTGAGPTQEPVGRPAGGEGRGAGAYLGLGLQFAISILLFLYAGQWLDRKLGSAPLFLILGVFLGAGAAFYNMYKKLMAAQREDEERAAAGQGR